jgi:hypothetical protein
MTSPSFSDVSLRTFQMQICIMLARLFILGSTLRKDAKNKSPLFQISAKGEIFPLPDINAKIQCIRLHPNTNASCR